jgi:hypothetical protein
VGTREGLVSQNPDFSRACVTPHFSCTPPEVFQFDNSGSPAVIVGVTDSGMDMSHPDLQRNRWRNLGEISCPANNETECCSNGVDDDDNGFVDDCYGYNFADNNSVLLGSDSHGTHVAGIVAADSNNGVGVAGTAGGDENQPGALLMTLTCFGKTENSGFAESIVYAADHGAAISQNSWSYAEPGVYDKSVHDAIDYFNANASSRVIADGGLVIFAAGNGGSDSAYYPGAYNGAVAVASLSAFSAQASDFTSYGDWVNISAPGGSILSTVVDGSYARMSGTSMACPYVSGVLALLISYTPNMDRQEYLNCMQSTATNIDSDNSALYTGKLGAGAINPYKLLSTCSQRPAPPPAPPSPPAPPPAPPSPPLPPPVPSVNVTVALTTDSYPGETSWFIRIPDGSVVANRSGFAAPNFHYVVQVPLVPDDYSFEIRDSFGDGICCAFGSGSYLVAGPDGASLAWGSTFTASQITQFTLAPPSPPDFGSGFGYSEVSGCTAASANELPVVPSQPSKPSHLIRTGTDYPSYSHIEPKIVGGDEYPPRLYQFLVSLQRDTGSHFCAGTLISPEWVVTAAHCTQGTVGRVVVGMHSIRGADFDQCVSKHEVEQIIDHESYNGATLEHDISLLKLATPVADYVPIDELDFGASVFQAAGKVLTVAGWGTLSSSGPSPDTPRRVDVPVVSNEECNEATAYGGLILDGMICAGNLSEGGVDACQGDSGGPMWGVDDQGSHVLTGIVSWGIG